MDVLYKSFELSGYTWMTEFHGRERERELPTNNGVKHVTLNCRCRKDVCPQVKLLGGSFLNGSVRWATAVRQAPLWCDQFLNQASPPAVPVCNLRKWIYEREFPNFQTKMLATLFFTICLAPCHRLLDLSCSLHYSLVLNTSRVDVYVVVNNVLLEMPGQSPLLIWCNLRFFICIFVY